jgi:hypothetical protein
MRAFFVAHIILQDFGIDLVLSGIPVRQPMRALVRLSGPADNVGTGRTSI